jgi:hypothetical protein
VSLKPKCQKTKKGTKTVNTQDDRTSEEIAIDRIERGSRCPWPKQASHPLFDLELLPLVFDPDELEHESDIERHRNSVFIEVGDLGEVSDDFRNGIVDSPCLCTEAGKGRVCVHSCTSNDLFDLSANLNAQIEIINRRFVVIRNKIVEVFDIITSWNVAHYIGLVSA